MDNYKQTPLHIIAEKTKNGNEDAVIKLLGSDIINKKRCLMRKITG